MTSDIINYDHHEDNFGFIWNLVVTTTY